MEKGVSVIIPTYNREIFIEETIQSVILQKIKNLEIIIADDGSTDQTLLKAKTFGNKVKILPKPDDVFSQGVAATRNRGLQVATKPLIAFLDSDDLYLPGHLIRMLKLFEETNYDVGFAFCRSLEFLVQKGEKLFKPWTRLNIFDNDIQNLVVSRSKIVNTNCFVFRKEVFEEVGIFNERFSNGEDGDMWMRISEKFKGRFLDYYGVAYRTNHGLNQLTKNKEAQKVACSIEIFTNARKRYYDLHLQDVNRIFKINYLLLNSRTKIESIPKLLYYILYLKLIFRYPAGFLQKVREEKEQKKETIIVFEWLPIEHYCDTGNSTVSDSEIINCNL